MAVSPSARPMRIGFASHFSRGNSGNRDHTYTFDSAETVPFWACLPSFSASQTRVSRRFQGVLQRNPHFPFSPNPSHLWTEVSSASPRAPSLRIQGLIIEPRRQKCKEESGKQRSHQTHEKESADCADFTDSEWVNRRKSAKSVDNLLALFAWFAYFAVERQ